MIIFSLTRKRSERPDDHEAAVDLALQNEERGIV